MKVLVVPRRFRGPAESGNGGWTAGALAELLGEGDAVEVTLRMPPPLELAMPVEPADGRLTARLEERAVAEARAVADGLVAVEAVLPEVARAAETTYAGLRSHPFPTCFSCGTGREPGDGLRIFPGFVAANRVAATWTPDDSVADPDRPGRATGPVTWAALDCVGGWAADVADRPMVLGRMTAAVDALPHVGDRHVAVGEVRGTDGRKTFTASTLYDPDGRVVGRAEHVWITIDPSTF
ncbi:hypothetical protein [Nocardioides sp.]|uniref:hypothetical protein n=1 Tax=Nocardioides sp. TaxID=35761 RepID=UPI0035270F5D